MVNANVAWANLSPEEKEQFNLKASSLVMATFDEMTEEEQKKKIMQTRKQIEKLVCFSKE